MVKTQMDNNIQKTYNELSHPVMGRKEVKEKTFEDEKQKLEDSEAE